MPALVSFSIMSGPWIGGESKDLAAPDLRMVKKYLTSGRILELKSLEWVLIRAKQGPSRHANAKAEGFALSVSLVSPPDSELTADIHAPSEIFIARAIYDHGVISGASTFASGAFISNYCMMVMLDSPILRKACFVIDWGLLDSSMDYTSEWGKEKLRGSIWYVGGIFPVRVSGPFSSIGCVLCGFLDILQSF